MRGSNARGLKQGGWLFFHDWFPRPRYTSRLAELAPFYELREDLSVRNTPQTLAVFARSAVRRVLSAKAKTLQLGAMQGAHGGAGAVRASNSNSLSR